MNDFSEYEFSSGADLGLRRPLFVTAKADLNRIIRLD
jgi:hypothetical protein